MWKRLQITTSFRWLVLCSWRGCDWQVGDEITTSPVFNKEGEFLSATDEETADDSILGEIQDAEDLGLDEYISSLGWTKQCNRCWRCKDDWESAFLALRTRYYKLAEKLIVLKKNDSS